MDWTEVKIYTTREGIEPVSAVLLETGITGIQIEDDDELKEHLEQNSIYWDYVDEDLLNKKKEPTKIKVYVSDNLYGEELLLNIKENIQRLKSIQDELDLDLGKLNIETTSNLNDEEWLNKWKEFYKPFKIGNKILVKPIWEELKETEGRTVFNINPGHVFGTGLHQTTQLCIENIEKYVNKESVVLDLGCGSGILSIISLLLGAKSAFAVDIDCNAVKVAYENAEINNLNKDKYYVTSGNVMSDENLLKEIGQSKYDIVLANIIADVICGISSFVHSAVKKDGIFIASGIINDRIKDVHNTLKQNKFQILETIIKDEWVCVVSKK